MAVQQVNQIWQWPTPELFEKLNENYIHILNNCFKIR